MAKQSADMVIFPYVDSEGVTHLVELTPAVAAELSKAMPAMRERLFRKPEGIEKVAEEDRYAAWFDGPRLKFRWLIGESRPWFGGMGSLEAIVGEDGLPRWECGFCKGCRLPSYSYCLGCDRCGRDREIVGPTAEEAAPGVGLPKDGLKGGCEGKV